jgi:hypothetical protein
MNTEDFDLLIESICGDGCIIVNKTIMLLEKEESPSSLQHLNATEHQTILKELKSIMDIYDGEVCSL